MSIRMRLTVWYSGILLLILLFLGVFIYLLLSHNLARDLDTRLSTFGLEVAQQIHEEIQVVNLFPFPLQEIQLPHVNVFATPDTYLQVRTFDGQVLSRSHNLGRQVLPISKHTLPLIREGEAFYETLRAGEQALRIYNIPIQADTQLIGWLQVGSSLVGLQNSLQSLRLILIIGGLLTFVLATTVGWFMAREALKPIERVTETAAVIQEGKDLARRIEMPPVADEVGRLVATLNDMLSRLESAYRELDQSNQLQKRFISDASHELRTPLTSIRGNLELLERLSERWSCVRTEDELKQEAKEILQDVQSEVERMIRLVQGLLTLARADAGVMTEKGPLSVSDWLPHSLRQVSYLPHENVAFVTEVDEQVLQSTLTGNADALQQLVYNLVDNAFKYTPEGTVRVKVWKEEKAGREEKIGNEEDDLVILVEDTGLGMDRETQEKLFQRFFRSDPARSRTGVGLGLAIAQRIVEDHQGEIYVQSEPGKGSTFTVRLPLET